MVCFMKLKMRIKPTSPKVTNSMKLTSQKKNNLKYYPGAVMTKAFLMSPWRDTSLFWNLKFAIKDIYYK